MDRVSVVSVSGSSSFATGSSTVASASYGSTAAGAARATSAPCWRVPQPVRAQVATPYQRMKRSTVHEPITARGISSPVTRRARMRRAEERRGGGESVSTCRCRWWQYHKQNKRNKEHQLNKQKTRQ